MNRQRKMSEKTFYLKFHNMDDRKTVYFLCWESWTDSHSQLQYQVLRSFISFDNTKKDILHEQVYWKVCTIFAYIIIKYIFRWLFSWLFFYFFGLLSWATHLFLCQSAYVREKPAGGRHVLYIACGGVICQKRTDSRVGEWEAWLCRINWELTQL